MNSEVSAVVPDGTIRNKMKYPLMGIIAAQMLLYLAPFVSMWLSLPVFAICVYRVVRYNARVFAVDYCMLLTVLEMFCLPRGINLMVFLCWFAGVYYFLKDGVKGDRIFVVFVVLLCYLLTRIKTNLNDFVILFGQIFMFYIVVPKQNSASAKLAAKVFCVSLIVSSAYGLLFRYSAQLYAIRGAESAVFWGSSLMRFQGIYEDPNYYMSLVSVGLTLAVKLYHSRNIRKLDFFVLAILLSTFGIITYSKSFFIVYLVIVIITIVFIFGDKNPLRTILLMILAALVVSVLLFADFSPFAVVMERFYEASNFDDFTTGRSGLFVLYWNAIRRSPQTLFFGYGFGEHGITAGAHNLYLEIWYYLGFIGLLLYLALFCSLTIGLTQKTTVIGLRNFMVRYMSVVVVLITYCSLHGITQFLSYGCFFLAFLSILIGPEGAGKTYGDNCLERREEGLG